MKRVPIYKDGYTLIPTFSKRNGKFTGYRRVYHRTFTRHSEIKKCRPKLNGKSANREGWVYAVRDQLTGLVKIGFSVAPENRVCELSTGCAGVLEIIAKIRGTMATEKGLHYELNQFRRRGEWFENESEILAAFARAGGQAA